MVHLILYFEECIDSPDSECSVEVLSGGLLAGGHDVGVGVAEGRVAADHHQGRGHRAPHRHLLVLPQRVLGVEVVDEEDALEQGARHAGHADEEFQPCKIQTGHLDMMGTLLR